MKRHIQFFLSAVLILICQSAIVASAITVITGFEESKIYVDGQFVGFGAIREYKVNPGTHSVKVMQNRDVIYSEMVDVDVDKVKTVEVERFVQAKTEVPNRTSKALEAKRIREAKGNFGVGLNLGYSSGLSFKYHFNHALGVQGTGWLFSTDTFTYYTWEARGLWTMVNTIMLGQPGSLYLASGFSRRQNTETSVLDYTDVALGLDFNLSPVRRAGSGTQVVQVGVNESLDKTFLRQMVVLVGDIAGTLITLDNAYFNIELGLGQINNHDTGKTRYTGIVGRAGLHYYF